MPKFTPCANHPAFFRLAISLLIAVTTAVPANSYAQGMLPMLDINPGAAAATMTPMTELLGAPLVEQQSASPTLGSIPAEEKLTPIPGHSETTAEPEPETPPAPEAASQPQSETPPAPEAASEPELQLKPATPTMQPLAIPTVSTTLAPAAVIPSETKSTPKSANIAAEKDETKSEAKTEKKNTNSKSESSSTQPATPHKPIKLSIDFSQAIQDAKNIFQTDEKAIKPISYSPMPGIAVFAVVKHGNERAFGDLPILFAREYAQRLGAKAPETKIYHPIYTVDELRMQGLGHVYDQIMSYYIKTGAPEPTATDYLLKQLSTNRPNISRIIFVEADVDMTHPDASTNLLDRIKKTMTDDMPKQMKYFVNSRLQIFDAEKPNFPIVWAGSWRRSITTDQFYNVTPSVYSDSDSQQAFAKVSRQMSQEILFVTPKEVYMIPQYDTALEGKLVSGKSQLPFPNLPESQPTPNGLSHENKEAIERILQRQNAIGPINK